MLALLTADNSSGWAQDLDFHEGFSFGYVGNFPAMRYGLAIGLTIERIGFHFDAKRSHLIGEGPEPDSLLPFPTARQFLQFMERTDESIMVGTSVGLAASYDLLPRFGRYIGAGLTFRDRYVQYRDPIGIAGPAPQCGSLHWLHDEYVGRTVVSLSAGVFLRAAPSPVSVRLGVESALRGVTVGISYTGF